MKKLIVLFAFFISMAGSAESPFGTAKQTFDKNLFFFELLGGATMPWMKYTDPTFSTYKSKAFIAGTGGIAFRMQFCSFLSIGSQFTYRSQGVNIQQDNAYKLHANYLNVYVPLEFTCNAFGFKKKVCPMMLLFAGPYLAQVLDGKEITKYKIVKLTSASFSKYDYGVEAGAGIRIPTFSANGRSNLVFRLSYYQGFADSYPVSFPNIQPSEMPQLFLSETGERKNRGIRATVSIELPMIKKANTTFVGGGDGRRTFKRFANIR